MTNELARRLEALERRMNAEGGPLRVVIVYGGLPPGDPLFAMASQHEWLRSPGEDLDAFCDRAAAAARELGEPLLLIGGLPRTQAQNDAAMAAYDVWAASDDGIPPMEAERSSPRRFY